MEQEYIRNFSIIAHIDHGKSTLADRMLELTHTVADRKMKEQMLDQMELERERGITIKLQPVRMKYHPQNQDSRFTNHASQSNLEYTLNLIDTPGHIDFSYEVSRALSAVEGVLLLVDATQGVQAQTLSTLEQAKKLGLHIIPVVTKIDIEHAQIDEVVLEIAALLDVDPSTVHRVSGKTGEGVQKLLDVLVREVPPPEKSTEEQLQSLVFDFSYSEHTGVIIYTRLFSGMVQKGDALRFVAGDRTFTVRDVGIFTPTMYKTGKLEAGEIGYIVTGIKEPGVVTVGDTIIAKGGSTPALPGYRQPKPVVWASLYPENADDLVPLRQALERLRLSDAALSFEEEMSNVLGKGFRCGFLGMLHVEIVTERLRREFELTPTITTPSVIFEVTDTKGDTETIYSPSQFPDQGDIASVREPWVAGEIITPASHVGAITQLLYEHEGTIDHTDNFGERTQLHIALPLRELYRNFFDALKSVTSGYASLSYELADKRVADVTRLDVLIAGESVPVLARVVSRRRAQQEAESLVERLHELLPRQQFATKIQVQGLGRILSSKTLKAFRKDVTAKLYGGDVTRKRKLLEKQKKGKKKLKEQASVNIPHETFVKLLRS